MEFLLGLLFLLLVMMWLPSFFRALEPTPESEAIRGRVNALQFMATNPTPDEFQKAWDDACEDEDFDKTDHGQAYTRAYKEVLRPYVK